ncbi:MAG TPA: hypothetical protein VHI93_06250 [Candidatus Thermoplasmatota archaeon]|nr:hypothetical protein [Candidatus Thermoplasmatota archaeon]
MAGYDPEVKLWFENMRRGSEETAEENIQVLYRYCEQQDHTPVLAEQAKKELRVGENQLLFFIGGWKVRVRRQATSRTA